MPDDNRIVFMQSIAFLAPVLGYVPTPTYFMQFRAQFMSSNHATGGTRGGGLASGTQNIPLLVSQCEQLGILPSLMILEHSLQMKDFLDTRNNKDHSFRLRVDC